MRDRRTEYSDQRTIVDQKPAITEQQPFPLIETSGAPEARGQSYGEQASDRIALGIANYEKAFRERGISWDRACKIAGSFIGRLDRDEPELLAEIRGIADGSSREVEEILALNCRTEIIYGQNGGTDSKTDGCTGIIALPNATSSGHVLHGQNWDWLDESADTAVVLRIRREDGNDILTQTEAGVLARCGLNSSGLALTGNFLKCDRDNSPGGIPIPFVRRRILEQSSYYDAMDVALTAPKSFSTNMMISDAKGDCINFEAVPGETFWMQPVNGVLVHANHFESVSALAKVVDRGLLVSPDTLYRGRRVREYMEKITGQIDLDQFKHALADKFGNPSAVCADPETEDSGATWSTVATILMDVTQRVMWVAPRPYARQSYTRYDLVH